MLLGFFKINDPSRLIILFVILVLIRLPFYIHGLITTQLDLNHMLIGESLANGATLYVNLWEGIAPLSAWVYMIIHFVFGKSVWIYHILALILTFMQCMIFNNITLYNKAYTENNYLPAAVFAIFMSVSFEMFSLTPVILSATFILLALNNVFSQVEFRMKKDEPILSIGVYIGIAALFYLPAAIFLPITILTLGIYSSTVGRRYLLIIYGFILPFVFIGLYYFMIDELDVLLRIMWFKTFSPDRIHYLNLTSLLIILSLPIFFFLLSLIRITKRSRFSNYQVRLIKLILLWILTSLLILIWSDRTVINFILFVPSVAFIVTHYFNLIKSRFKSEMMFNLMYIGIVFIGASGYAGWFGLDKYIKYDKIIIAETQYDELVKNKRIVVLGDSINIYKKSSLGTPFLDWPLSREVLANPDYYDNISLIFDAFESNPPEVIIDSENLIPNIQKRMPLIGKLYKQTRPGVYELR